jgi:hypothetical protein
LIALRQARFIRADSFDHSRKLMPEHAGIGKEGLVALKRMQVRTAYANALYAYDGFAVGQGRFRQLDFFQLSDFFAHDA